MEGKILKEFPNYVISRNGEVYSKLSSKNLNRCFDGNHYWVNLYNKDKKRVRRKVSALVATAYIPNPEGVKKLKHKDGNVANNKAENLEWVGKEKKHNVEGKTIPEYPNYIITGEGKVYSKIYSRPLTPHKQGKYYYLRLYRVDPKTKERKRVYKSIHRLVAMAHISNPQNLPIVNHKDGNTVNNTVENLEWVSHQRSVEHAYENDLIEHYTRPVIQYSLKGSKLAEFSSAKEAFQKTGVKTRSISKVCLGHRKTAGGYKWKFVTPNKDVDSKENEIWKRIPGHSKYMISSEGQILSLRYARCLKPRLRGEGYLRVALDKKKEYYVQVLMAKTFLGEPPSHLENPVVNHKNGDKSDNRLENLEWAEFADNIVHAHKTGLNTTCKPCVQYSLDGKKIKEYPSVAEAARAMKVSHTSILVVCDRKIHCNTSKGFIWRYACDPLEGEFSPKTSKTKVDQYERNGKFLKTWDSINEAVKEVGISSSSISKCCSGKSKTSGGYIWRYHGSEPPAPQKGMSKRVGQYSKSGDLIREWDSISQASKELGIGNSHIISVCKGRRKTTGGYGWKYL